ncbi:unnamed protein product [Brassica oleracea var. botrytis]
MSYFPPIYENLAIRSLQFSAYNWTREIHWRQKEVTDSAETTQRSSLKLGYMDESERRKNVKEEKKIAGEEEKVSKKTDPSSPVSVFTVVATTTACHHTGHLSLFQSLSLFLYVGALVVTGMRRRRKKTIMTLRPGRNTR